MGYLVHLVDVSPTIDLAARLRGVARTIDVADDDTMEHLAETAADAEVVCLNAGIVGATMGAPWEAPPGEWRRLIDVNVLGVVNGLRAFVPRMTTRAAPSRIIITGSLAGLVTFPGGGAYGATKHAVVALAEGAAAEGRFLVVPPEWRIAATVRAERLASGEVPSVPMPSR
jgi:NAD(P)-dependent dehydrogenase (short-subunit alcohol dehydrogenase family)